jgi:tight adherence protein B
VNEQWVPIIAALLILSACLLFLYAWLAPAPDADSRQRVQDLDQHLSQLTAPATKRVEKRMKITEQLIDLGDRAAQGRKSTEVTQALLTRANLPMRAGEWLVLRSILAFILTLLGLSFSNAIWGGFLGLVIGAFAPTMVLRFMAKRRASKFEDVLPDVLTLLATSLSSGFGLAQALDAVAKDAAEPAATEFSRAVAETRIGTSMAAALEKVADRMDSESMRWTMMAIKIQQNVGGNLAGTLHSTAETLRERAKLRGLIKALSAEGVLSAYILLALPVGLFFWMVMANRDYVSLLWTTLFGIIMLAVASVMLVIGIVWMRSTVRIEV